ncbi:MAG: PLP-dependent aspartate aminotransferase family protein [Saprospiraceae bacterium]
MNLSEILCHLGENRKDYFNAVSPPIIQSSNFIFDNLTDFRKAFAEEKDANVYTRGNNPTVAILRKKLAALEKAEDCLVFGSGASANAMAILSQVHQSAHVVCVNNSYSWTFKMLTEYLPKFGVTHTFVDGTNLEEIEAAIQPNTTLLFLESPTSIVLELQDLKACAEIAKKHGIVTAIDNSYSSPIFQRPIEHGIDIVIHSGTKYLNGHSDVVVGVVCSSKEIIKKMFYSEFMTLGAIISPNDAMLVIRGLRTLELRVKRSHESGMKITSFLENHSKVEKVNYPFSPNSPQYDLAKKQMDGAGGLFSLYLKTDSMEKAEAFFQRLKRFSLAVSWGGHESLVLPFCAFYNIPGKEDTTLPFNLVRFYIGLEDPDWLISDLEQALEII